LNYSFIVITKCHFASVVLHNTLGAMCAAFVAYNALLVRCPYSLKCDIAYVLVYAIFYHSYHSMKPLLAMIVASRSMSQFSCLTALRVSRLEFCALRQVPVYDFQLCLTCLQFAHLHNKVLLSAEHRAAQEWH
jgi:hypothetical protein